MERLLVDNQEENTKTKEAENLLVTSNAEARELENLKSTLNAGKLEM